MTDEALRTFRHRLRETAKSLGGDVNDLLGEAMRPTAAYAGAATADGADPATQSATEEVTLAVLDSECSILGEVNAALERIDRGTFGRCESCNRVIPRARLEALPYARDCIACAAKNETRTSP